MANRYRGMPQKLGSLCLFILAFVTPDARSACSSVENSAYLRIARQEWKEKPPLTPELSFRTPVFFCRRFLRFWRSDKMESTRLQYGDLCRHVEQPMPLFSPSILGVCPCACTNATNEGSD